MVTRAHAINKTLLTWARERAGFSVEQFAARMNKDVANIQSWEDGSDDAVPTYRQLEKIAGLFKRPIALFFFSVPPNEPLADEEFRMLPKLASTGGFPDTLFAIRDIHAKQLRILELARGASPASDKFLFETARPGTATSVRKALGVDLSVQVSWKSSEQAFKQWRTALEACGVFVFKRSFKQRAVSGLCLWHNVAPVILVNNSTTWNRQVFTLFHELAHLLHRHNGMTRADKSYLGSLDSRELKIETACNKFAAEFLVPRQQFLALSTGRAGDDDSVESLASHFNVSREVILRRLLDEGMVTSADYQKRAGGWNKGFYQRGGDGTGGNYFTTQASYLGQAYMQLAFSSYHSGESTLSQLADMLSVKARNIAKLEAHVV